MTVNQYVNAIANKIKCSGDKKKEIKQQLLTDINLRISQGEKPEDVMAQMGSVKEIADSFNENISDIEKKRYSRNKALKIVIPCVMAFVLLLCFGYWFIPKSYDIGKSEYFNAEDVEAAMKETVELLDAGEYETLQENSIAQIKSFLNAEAIEKGKSPISDDWGEREKFGTVYMVELVQCGSHFAVGEIMVSYENVVVTYRLTYDREMRLAGIYMR